jgi:hypothetical protein
VLNKAELSEGDLEYAASWFVGRIRFFFAFVKWLSELPKNKKPTRVEVLQALENAKVKGTKRKDDDGQKGDARKKVRKQEN